jgi:superfamily I DNA/RNA helicase
MRLPSYQDLSKEQDRINDLPIDGRHLVVGAPGTGKTVMGLYRAAMLKRARRRAKLLMYSRLLTQYTQNAADELLLDGTVETFHRWFFDFYYRNYGRRPPEAEPYRYDFSEALTLINSSPPTDKAESDLIVDEGQDLPKEFYLLTPLIADNVVVFADENQRITDWCSSIAEIKAFGGFREVHSLTRNYRNTREIADLAAAFYTGLSSGVPESPQRSGQKPVLRRHANLDAFADALRIYEQNNEDRTIGVFVPNGKVQRRLIRVLEDKTRNPVQSYQGGLGAKAPKLRFDAPGIIVTHYKSAKGLEFDSVFIPELQDVVDDLESPEIRMKFYVLVSRAREELYLSYSGIGEPAIINLIPPDLVERR